MPTEENGDQRLERLRRAIDEGGQSGEPEPFDVESFLKASGGGRIPFSRCS
ncbi:hypothetical protein FJW04_10020 [Mesorhizobium sp. B2-7-3]|uniref:type II toxin-antitoxin system ParD family antitoxin n=1 Tax=Mesorhizobium sp. BR-1-1-10 TaxID=2876660 RepID=UPI00112DA977|nr:type II toxin-antitoxin system ParD family antitoxin [Mesorhizobium sp. BR-1-1-10]TPJ17860.1 hypothetical protein FJW04_10020 [Mesorhizobium sp. B2-7-3]